MSNNSSRRFGKNPSKLKSSFSKTATVRKTRSRNVAKRPSTAAIFDQSQRLKKMMKKHEKNQKHRYLLALNRYNRKYFISEMNLKACQKLMDFSREFRDMLHRHKQENDKMNYVLLDSGIQEILASLRQLDLHQSPLLAIKACMKDRMVMFRDIKSLEFANKLKTIFESVKKDTSPVVAEQFAEYLKLTKPPVKLTRQKLTWLYDNTKNLKVWTTNPDAVWLFRKELATN